ncbi:FAD-dependent oxidoreductase [Pantoea sp. B65]|uniref:FAD-dependent oxidoreductase n=1 Tax=Pantoea sp. B65 TaxID=2813359 RepID=UPI0039B6295B
MSDKNIKWHDPNNNLRVPGWDKPQPPLTDYNFSQVVEADVVIVGAGCAGLFLAHSAAEHGLKVALVEKFPALSARGMDNGAVNSKLQLKSGKKIDEDLIFADLIRFANNRVHPELVAIWVRQSGRVFDHYIDLCEAHGMKVALVDTFSVAKQYPDLYRQYPTAHIFAGADQKISTGNEYVPTQQAFLDFIEDQCKKLGVNFYYNIACEEILRQDNGRVSGIIGKNKSGEYIRFSASNAVVLAAGGYSENKEMVNAWCPIINKAEIKTYNPQGGNIGEVLGQALDIGAALQNWPHPVMIHTIPGFHVDLMTGNQSFMQVNRLGKRFQNESLPNQSLVDGRFRQPNQQAWAVFDSRYEIDHQTFETGFDGPVTEPIDVLNTHADKGRLFRANSLEELARQMDIPVDSFVATCKRYSEMAHKGKDEDFNKEPYLMFPVEKPPFYAVPIRSHMLVTLGGLDCDPDMQVLDIRGNKVEGLYAVGNMQGNFFANEYPLMAPGLSHGRAITLSYVLGERLAENKTLAPKAKQQLCV